MAGDVSTESDQALNYLNYRAYLDSWRPLHLHQSRGRAFEHASGSHECQPAGYWQRQSFHGATTLKVHWRACCSKSCSSVSSGSGCGGQRRLRLLADSANRPERLQGRSYWQLLASWTVLRMQSCSYPIRQQLDLLKHAGG